MVIQTSFSTMKNLYYGLRHGEREANVAGIIVSNPEDGVDKYGLTKRGVEQVTSRFKDISQF